MAAWLAMRADTKMAASAAAAAALVYASRANAMLASTSELKPLWVLHQTLAAQAPEPRSLR